MATMPGNPGAVETDITVTSSTAGVVGSPKKIHVTLSNPAATRKVFMPVIVKNME
jgi:hypothetical protein